MVTFSRWSQETDLVCDIKHYLLEGQDYQRFYQRLCRINAVTQMYFQVKLRGLLAKQLLRSSQTHWPVP